MNCHKDNKGNQEGHNHSPIKHMIHMMLCCGLPIIIIISLPLIARVNPVVATGLGFIAPFICPIMMGGMVLMMFGKKKKSSCCDTVKNESNK